MQSASASDCRVSSPGVAQEYDVHMTTASPTNLDISLICRPYNSEAAHWTDEMPAVVIKANACEDSTKRYMYAVCYQTIQGTVCADSIGRRLLSSRIVGVVGFASLLKGLLLCCCPTGASLVLAYIAIRICTVHCHACHSVSCRRWVVNCCAAVVYFTLGLHWAVLVAMILAVSPRALLWWPSETDSSEIYAHLMAEVDKLLNTQHLRGIRNKVDMSCCSDPEPVLCILHQGYDELANHVNLYSDFQKTQAGIVSDIKAELAQQVRGEPCAKSTPRSVLIQDIGNSRHWKHNELITLMMSFLTVRDGVRFMWSCDRHFDDLLAYGISERHNVETFEADDAEIEVYESYFGHTLGGRTPPFHDAYPTWWHANHRFWNVVPFGPLMDEVDDSDEAEGVGMADWSSDDS